MAIELIPGGIYADKSGCILRVRGVHEGHVLADEIGPKASFSVNSPYHGDLTAVSLDVPTDPAEQDLFFNDESLAHLRQMRDYWLERAVEYQNMAYARRSWFAKAGDVLGFVLLVVPYRLIARAFGYKGPFS